MISTTIYTAWAVLNNSGALTFSIAALRNGTANINNDGGNNKPTNITRNLHHQYTICWFIENSILHHLASVNQNGTIPTKEPFNRLDSALENAISFSF